MVLDPLSPPSGSAHACPYIRGSKVKIMGLPLIRSPNSVDINNLLQGFDLPFIRGNFESRKKDQMPFFMKNCE